MFLSQNFKISNAPSHRRRDENGYLFVDESPVLQAGILEYYGHELLGPDETTIDGVAVQPDEIYKVYVPPEELKRGADTFKLLPITNDHQWLGVEGADARDYQEGTTGETAVFKNNAIYVPLKFTGDGIIQDILDGKEELSASYTNKLTKSDNPDYDFVASDIRGNHVALVTRGRCGPAVRVLNQQPNKANHMKVKNGMKLVIGDQTIDLDKFFRQEEQEDAHRDTGAIVENEESVDKRKLIDEIGGILKGKVDEELWRTVIGKTEKLAYDASETSKADNVDKRELIREIMAVAGKSNDEFAGGEDEKVREIAKLAEQLAYNPSEDSRSDNEEPDDPKDCGVKSQNSAENLKKLFNAWKQRQDTERDGQRRAYNAARELMGEFNPFGLSERDMLVRALNHCGVDVGQESVPELYAMLKVCNSQTKIDNGFNYDVDNNKEEITINI